MLGSARNRPLRATCSGACNSSRVGFSGKIGYAANSSDLQHPADRRRFPVWAESRGVDWEIADPSKQYDLVVVTPRADLNLWRTKTSGQSKLIFDMVDSYLAIPATNLKQALRGPAKFLAGEANTPFYSYRKAIERIVEQADAVTCATPEQASALVPFNDNVHSILDIHSGLIRSIKDDYAAHQPFRLVWEGLGTNVHWFELIAPVLAEVAQQHPICLNIISDIEFHEFVQKFGRRRVAAITADFAEDVRLYQWSEDFLSLIATNCDLAVIPLPVDRAYATDKPESKLVSFWRMGLPVVTAATPAYKRVMSDAGQELTCVDQQQWLSAITRMIEDAGEREQAGREGRRYADQVYGEEQLLARWDSVIESLETGSGRSRATDA